MKKTLFFLPIFLILIAGCKQGSEVSDHRPEASRGESTIAGSLEGKTYESKVEEKIIRSAYVTIQSGRVNEAYDRTLSLVKKYEGIIINSSTSTYGETEEAQIEIKIQPQYFLTLLDELKDIGKVESKNISEEDVTEEYYDIKARLRNAQKVQERLYQLLKKANKVEEILKVEKEIERVGENIERLEGKIRYLDSKTDYARVTVTIYNRRVRIIDASGIWKGFERSFQYSVQFFFVIIWIIIILIPLFIFIIILRPVIPWVIRIIKRKK